MTGRYPRRFGKYVLLKPMAKGGMGEIYLAAGGDVGGFEKLCVIKKVITEKADRAKSKRFLDEAKVVLRLSHSALVNTFDAGDVAGEFYIAMELVEGKDLREVWNRCVRTRQRIPLDVALHVVREVARALAYVHGYGELKLVHRDVAPPNILLAYVGDVKLTDFGLARSVLKQEHTAPGVVFGRAAYLAPEQARGEIADARTDVYTLGIVLWELLTGQQFLQLAGLDPAAALAIVRNPKLAAPSTRAPWISPALDDVAMRALSSDRQQRFQTAEELRQALSEVITDIAPRADASRVAEFLRNIYSDTIEEERIERDRFLKEMIPQFRGGLLDGEGATEPVSSPAPEGDLPPARSGPRPVLEAPPPKPLTVARPPEPEPPRVVAAMASGADHEAARASSVARVRAEPGAAEPSASRPPPMPAAPRPLRAPPVRLPGLPPGPQAPRNGAPAPRPPTLRSVPEPARSEPEPPAVTAPSVPSGPMVAGHRLTHLLLEGRLGSLHRAVRTGASQEISLRIYAGAAPDAAALERLREQARRLARLGHPHIAAAADLGLSEDGHLYAVLEPLAGADLAAVLHAERRLEGARALEISTQIAGALAAAHAAGILHLCLEPERVLVTPGGADQVKVLDFGVPLPRDGAEATSLLYCAPEQLLGAPVDGRSDVYALAAVLYEAVTGAPPHAGSPDPAARKLSEPVQSPRMFRPEMPLDVERLLLAALDRDPERRPPSMAAFEEALAALARAAGGSGPGSTARPASDKDRRRARREAAFRTIGELLSAPADAPPPAPMPTPPFPRAASLVAVPAVAGPEGVTVGAFAHRYGGQASGRRGRYLLFAAGFVALAGALAWRYLR